jgi:hypothetical protein
MRPEETFGFPGGDIIIRATHGKDSCDFRVHKTFLYFSSPVFKDMLSIPQPSSTPSNDVDLVDVTDPPRALELVLRFIYPSAKLPVINNLSLLSEALVVADKYGIGVARSQLRSSFKGFMTTEPLRVYAIACQFGFEDEMKIASWHTTSIHLPGLTELPPEFKFIPATEYHRLILLHLRYRKKVAAIAKRSPLKKSPLLGLTGLLSNSEASTEKLMTVNNIRKHFTNCIIEGIPLDYGSLIHSLETKNSRSALSRNDIISSVFSILREASALNLTV